MGETGNHGQYYKLGADLDLSSETSWNHDKSFNFYGYFDNQGHTIRVNIVRDTESDL